MKQIVELTPTQEGMLSIWRDKWIDIGLSTERISRDKAVEFAKWLYPFLGMDIPLVVLMGGPISSWYATVYLHCMLSTGTNVSDDVLDRVGNQVWNQVTGQVWNQETGQLEKDYMWSHMEGQFDSGFFSFYSYMREVLGVPLIDHYTHYESTVQFGPIYPLEHVCVFCDRPTVIHKNATGLHHDGGPSIEYLDGTKVWALNGVRVSQEIAEGKATDLDPKILLSISNAEVRREFVRKVGIERICSALDAKVVDSVGDYSLLMLELQDGDGRRRPYLKMMNPSLQLWHIEGVHPDCNTVEKALAWRNGMQTYQEPQQLT